MPRLSPLQRAYFHGLRQGKRQVRREIALLVEEFDTESLLSGSEAELKLEPDRLLEDVYLDMICVTSDDGV